MFYAPIPFHDRTDCCINAHWVVGVPVPVVVEPIVAAMMMMMLHSMTVTIMNLVDVPMLQLIGVLCDWQWTRRPSDAPRR